MMNRWLQAYLIVGGILVAAEIADGFRIEFPIAAWVFGAITGLGLAWTAWGHFGGRAAGPVMVGLLAAVELSGVAFTYTRPTNAFEVTIYVVIGILCSVVIAASIGTVVTSFDKGERARLAATGL